MLELSKLRPTTNTPSDIAEALEQARAATAIIAANLANAKAARDALLLEGTAADLKAAEKTVSDTAADVERLAAIVPALEARAVEAALQEGEADRQAAARQRQELYDAALAAGASHNARWAELRGILQAAAGEMVSLRDAYRQAASNFETHPSAEEPSAMPSPRVDFKLAPEALNRAAALKELAGIPA